jgi:hypothetical protein
MRRKFEKPDDEQGSNYGGWQCNCYLRIFRDLIRQLGTRSKEDNVTEGPPVNYSGQTSTATTQTSILLRKSESLGSFAATGLSVEGLALITINKRSTIVIFSTSIVFNIGILNVAKTLYIRTLTHSKAQEDSATRSPGVPPSGWAQHHPELDGGTALLCIRRFAYF